MLWMPSAISTDPGIEPYNFWGFISTNSSRTQGNSHRPYIGPCWDDMSDIQCIEIMWNKSSNSNSRRKKEFSFKIDTPLWLCMFKAK